MSGRGIRGGKFAFGREQGGGTIGPQSISAGDNLSIGVPAEAKGPECDSGQHRAELASLAEFAFPAGGMGVVPAQFAFLFAHGLFLYTKSGKLCGV